MILYNFRIIFKMILILMETLKFSLMEIFLVFIQQTLVRIFPLSTENYLAPIGLDSQSSDETQLFDLHIVNSLFSNT